MLPILIAMTVILILAALVLLYAAFPHRGEQVPAVPWLGEAMERATDALPVLTAEDEQRDWSLTTSSGRE